MPRLDEIPLDKTMEEAEYQEELDKLQKRLGELHNRLYRKRVPLIIAYEGWDAAGKGGNIKRITGALDPRGFEVHPIASPSPMKRPGIILWRFWTRLPKTGHIAILTAHGTEGLWWNGLRASAVPTTGREPIMK